MSDDSTYLTEAILIIQNELQTALDYIETVASQETSQLGAAPSLITVENLRVRIPFVFQVEKETHPVTPEEEPASTPWLSLSKEEIARLKSRLLSRKGMLIETEPGQLGRFAKIRLTSITYPPPADEPAAADMVGNIELTFTRVPRTLEPVNPVTPAPEVELPEGNPVPNIIGNTLDEATGLLTKANWRFEAHAASKEQIAQTTGLGYGRVLIQKPEAGVRVDKAATTVHFWVALSNLPVNIIDGIGKKLSGRLNEIGISTVGHLSIAQAKQVAQVLQVKESRASEFIDMAVFISHLAIAGLKDEVAELLVKGAQIRTISELTASDPTQLYEILRDSIDRKQVQLPGDFSLTPEDVAGWIKTARS
jgi:hypothetical protein